MEKHKSKLVITLLTLAYLLLAAAFVLVLPYAQDGYNQRVIAAYKAETQAGIAQSLDGSKFTTPAKPQGIK